MKRKWIIILSIVGLLVILRLIAPYFLLRMANRKLEDLNGYKGVVKDIDLRLYKGAYVIDSAYFSKTGTNFPEPFMAAEEVEIMIDWNSLFRFGEILAYVTVINAELNFAVGVNSSGTEPVEHFGKGVNWLQQFKDMSPLEFNKLRVKNSKITYSNFTTDPEINAFIDNIEISADNLQNPEDKEESLPGEMELSAVTLGGGSVNLNSKVNFVNKPVDMNMNLVLEGMEIVDWNDFMKVYTGLDFETGIFNLYSEIIVKDNKVEGYVKPVIDNVSLLTWEQEKGSFLDKAWEAIAGAVTEIFENQQEDQLASRVPISGSLEDTEANEMTGIWNIFKNAFIEAFDKELEHDLNPDQEQ